MNPQPSPTNTIGLLVQQIRTETNSQLVARNAENLLRRAEPIARLVCNAHARQLPTSQVEELVQDVLLAVWRGLSGYDDQGRFESWVRGIARNVCSSARRRKRELLTDDGVIEKQSMEADVLRQLRREERKRVLTQAIEALDAQDQDVLYHRYVHDLERQQIAELLELNDIDQVRVAIQRASRRLRAELARRLEELGHTRSLFRSNH